MKYQHRALLILCDGSCVCFHAYRQRQINVSRFNLESFAFVPCSLVTFYDVQKVIRHEKLKTIGGKFIKFNLARRNIFNLLN